MFNAEKPSLDQLPSSAQLIRSTIIAGVAAIAVLVTIVLPAEYGVDPLGAGRVLGLTEMGEIKQELADEAREDEAVHGSDQSSRVLDGLLTFFVGSAHADDAWTDELTFTLSPGEGGEVKLVMAEGDIAEYAWEATGGRINFDLHAHGGGQSIDYERGRGKTDGKGSITAPFAGEHGWFWRNRDDADVTIRLRLKGSYSELLKDL